jgi:hypothetical protein
MHARRIGRNGERGPSTAMTSWMRTSRLVPLNVMPTSGADSRVRLADMFVGFST